jgi:hypothetical protein
MNTQRVALALTIANLALGGFLVSQTNSVSASDVAPVLRGRSLEIVDAQGRVRASIKVEPPTTVNAQKYPEAVVFRLRDSDDAAPGVKLDTSREGAGMTFAGGKVRLMAKRGENFVSVTGADGREQVLKP